MIENKAVRITTEPRFFRPARRLHSNSQNTEPAFPGQAEIKRPIPDGDYPIWLDQKPNSEREPLVEKELQDASAELSDIINPL